MQTDAKRLCVHSGLEKMNEDATSPFGRELKFEAAEDIVASKLKKKME